MNTAYRLLIAVALLLAGCDPFRSDSENFHRQREAERAERIAGMRAATDQATRGTPVSDDALRTLLSGNTHVAEYEVSPLGKHERYVEYDYFRADGVLVYRNTAWALAPEGTPGDHWSIDGPRLCVLRQSLSPDEHCYTIAVTGSGSIQYFISAPGQATDGLLTREIRIVQAGEPQVEKP